MIGVETIYRLTGFTLLAVAYLNARDATNPKRYRTALFWATYAASLLLGSILPDFVNGLLVITLVIVGALGLGRGGANAATAARVSKVSNRVFFPALLVPALTLIATLTLRNSSVLDPKNLSLIALGLSAVTAMVVAVVMLRQPVMAPFREGRRLMDLIGWAAILPQMLASLGALFAAAGVGDRVAELLQRFVPLDNGFVVVCTYCLGMALFTVIMGNAFAAFPVMTAAVGIPIIVHRLGGNPAVMAAIGMLSGFCGTLMTPMAANFNIVPAALLELPDKNGVIRAQVPTALVLLAANTLLMYVMVFR